MDPWDDWEFARVYLLLLAFALLAIGAQVLLFHWRAGFGRWTMYAPVVLAPVLALAAVAAAIMRDGVLGWLALAAFVIGIAAGVVGLLEHFNGIRRRIGGLSLRNLMSGPPPLLPGAFMALSLTGAVAVLWQAL